MPIYRVKIEGRNFLMGNPLSNRLARMGFFTHRWVRAKDEASAESKALNLVRKELKGVPLNEATDPPMLYTLEIVEVLSFHKNLGQGKGCAWYPPRKGHVARRVRPT